MTSKMNVEAVSGVCCAVVQVKGGVKSALNGGIDTKPVGLNLETGVNNLTEA